MAGLGEQQDIFSLVEICSSTIAVNKLVTEILKGPDFCLSMSVETIIQMIREWVIWEEGGRYPDVIVELLFSR